MKRPESDARVWPWLGASVVTVIVIAAIRWSLDHPLGIHWDEADYLNTAFLDSQRLLSGSWIRLGGRLLLKSWGRPPAYRLLALPFFVPFGFHTTAARLASLACFGCSAWFIYAAMRRLATSAAAALAVCVFALSPEVVSGSIFFSTDAPLYLATSAFLYFMFEFWHGASALARNWIGLGIALGLGFLAKTSFLLIAIPALAYWLVISRWGNWGIPPAWSAWKSGLLAALIAGPWWLLNFKSALAYAQFARAFVRNSLGPPSLLTWARWLQTVFQCLLGLGVGILIGLVLLLWIARRTLRKELALGTLQRLSLGACASAGLPIVLAQLAGTNHLLRHISPAVIPLAIVVGLLADGTGSMRYPIPIAAMLALCVIQLAMLVYPVAFPNNHPVGLGYVNGSPPWRIMARIDQWDWEPLLKATQSCGLQTPQIGYLGNGREMNPPAINQPWVRQNSSANVQWLWRYEEGPLDWQKVMSEAEQSDVVLTAPFWTGESRTKEDWDNRQNAEFFRRLSQDAHLQQMASLYLGRFDPVEVAVFVNRKFACR